MVEAVLVVPVMMLLLLVVVQFALWAHAAQVAQLAASEGDRAARSVDGGPAVGLGRARAVMSGSGSDMATSDASVDVVAGNLIRVAVTGSAVSILPGMSLPVSAVQVGPIQQFSGSE